MTDYKGQALYNNEEYYNFGDYEDKILVSVEDVCEYLDDDRLNGDSYEILIHQVYLYHNNYPQKYNGGF